jgi:hypothetical protein
MKERMILRWNEIETQRLLTKKTKLIELKDNH